MTSSRLSANRRLYTLAAILAAWCCCICIRLTYLQIFRYGSFEERAQHQQQRTEELSPRRGIIYDRAGRELAMSISVESVFAVPSEIPDLAGTISLIAHIAKADPRELLAKCKASRSFCWLSRKADADVANRIRSLNLRGIYFQKESKRFYPKRELAAQILGYVGMDDRGLSGIEREYENELQGKPGTMLISVDARKKWFGSVERQPEAGENVVLTIDEQIQYIAERELQTVMEQTHGEAGTIVVENPHTGEILALANWPTFNPNLSREITPQRLKNHAVSDVYEPGSTFKLVTLSAALEEKITNPNEVFDCQMGSIVVNGMRIHDAEPWGNLSVTQILEHSSSVGAIKIALRLGDDRFYKYIREFGFGQPTGIELPGETRGLTKPVSRWSKVSIAAISMGQEIGVTPLQIAALVSSIANDGVRLAPRIVAGAAEPQSGPQGIAYHPAAGQRVVSTMTAAEMKQMMQKVVLEGTGRKAILEGYSSAGKTGTSQKIDPATHTYSHRMHIASFAGFAPVNNPQITVVVVVDNPQGPHYYGADVSAPVFQRVAQQVLEYMHAPHDIELPPSRQVLLAARRIGKEDDNDEGSPDHPGEPLETAESTPIEKADSRTQASIAPSAPWSPSIVPAAERERVKSGATEDEEAAAPAQSQSSPSVQLPPGGTVVIDMEQGGIVVPSFLGKSVREAIETAEEAGITVDVVGSGLGQQQVPSAGSHVATGTRVTVQFSR